MNLPEKRDTANRVPPHAYAFWASFLHYSPFGTAISALRVTEEFTVLSDPLVQLQLFFFKVCEIRKVLCLWRRRWYHICIDELSRRTYIQEWQGPIFLPIFTSQTEHADSWTLYVRQLRESTASTSQFDQTTVMTELSTVLKHPAAALKMTRTTEACKIAQANAKARRGDMPTCDLCRSSDRS